MLLASVLWEETDAINQAKQLLHNFLTNGSVIPANLREVRVWKMCCSRSSQFRKHKINFHLGCLHRCRTLGRIHVLAILLGSIYLVTWLTRRNNRTTSVITSIGKNQRRLVICETKSLSNRQFSLYSHKFHLQVTKSFTLARHHFATK